MISTVKEAIIFFINDYEENIEEIYCFLDIPNDTIFKKIMDFELTEYPDDDIWEIELIISQLMDDGIITKYYVSYENLSSIRDLKASQNILLDFFKNYYKGDKKEILQRLNNYKPLGGVSFDFH